MFLNLFLLSLLALYAIAIVIAAFLASYEYKSKTKIPRQTIALSYWYYKDSLISRN